MPADNNRVRRLDDARSDKTGTLTTNRVTVMQIGIDGQGFTSASQTPDEMSESTRHVFCNGVCINSTAEILPPVDSLSTWGTRPSVPVLMQLVRDCGVDHLNARHETRSQADVQQQEEARSVINLCHRAGIVVRMVTGVECGCNMDGTIT
ncbi:hypothetical protein PF001_g19606 [Phytophthora fragariae]|uniref:Uncharacterized protein n=1 Tax=Phytophthora fragariae TaxID=53985 RepID=A0A6A4CQA8_9STRA|nr:hypothetical protein PF003_g5918 [Phytophthora fragariae]KAE8988085.1 hypothetical protein PF011_g19313 [Phytophthora fragariae]KAE9290452.1 hypothetical protein PF001_g19606 [Phytophthora fragariae]KAE9319830.1 hypothetical protein PF008_g18173 [Phytophthora fragariae]